MERLGLSARKRGGVEAADGENAGRDHAEHGGGLLLGVAGICIISHGSSQAPSIFNAIRLAKEAVDHQVLERISSQYQKTALKAADGE